MWASTPAGTSGWPTKPGPGWAKLLAFTGRRLDARTAERIGVVQQVTTTEELLPTAMAVAEEIAANAPLAVQSIKRTIDGFTYRGFTEAMRFGAMSSARSSSSPTTCPPGTPPRPRSSPSSSKGSSRVPLPEPPPAGRSMLPADTFEGTTVVVTGGGTGLGRAIAVEFGRLGAAVGIVSRDEGHRLAGVAAVEAVGARAAHAGGRHPPRRGGGRLPSTRSRPLSGRCGCS